MKKLVAVGITLLFLAVIVTPTVNYISVQASAEDEFVDVTSQVSGPSGVVNHSIRLSQYQYIQLQTYLCGFEQSLNNSSSPMVTRALYLNALRRLDSLGLLPSKITPECLFQRIYSSSLMDSRVRKNSLSASKENFCCLLSGKLTHVYCQNFFSGLALTGLDRLCSFIDTLYKWTEWAGETHHVFLKVLLTILYGVLSTIFYSIPDVILFFLGPILMILFFAFQALETLSPIALTQNMGIGSWESVPPYPMKTDLTVGPAVGWIDANGLKGHWYTNGTFMGGLPLATMLPFMFVYSQPGIAGFTGVKIWSGDSCFFIGSALLINIHDYPN